MKLVLLLLTGLLPIVTKAQTNSYHTSKELRGSGRVVRETPATGRFDAIEIRQFPANLTIDVGGTESSVSISVDDNLRPLLRVENKDGTLKLSFNDPQNKPFWISKANVDVRITTPALKRLTHGSNSNVTVTGLRGEAFALTNQANGNVTLSGKVETFDVVSSANGTIDADRLVVQTADVVAQANATIRVNARKVSLVRQAFANVVNVADQPNNSAPAANLIRAAKSSSKLVTIRFRNTSPLSRKVTLISYAPGDEGNETNGFTLAPYANREKQYPVGTAVYVATEEQVDLVMRGGRLRSKPLLTVETDDEGRTVKLD